MGIWILWISGRSARSFLKTDYLSSIFGRNVGIPFVNPVHPLSSIITRDGKYDVRDVRRTTGHFRNPVRAPPNIAITMALSCEIIRAIHLCKEGLPRGPFELQNHIASLRHFRRVLVEELVKTDELLKGELEADEAYFEGKRKGKGSVRDLL